MALQDLVWIAKTLVLPPGILILLALLGFFLSRRVIGKMLLVVSIAGLYLMSTGFFANRLMQPLENATPLDQQTIQSSAAQAIVVLGGGRRKQAPEFHNADTVSGLGLERLRYAAYLAKLTGLPVIPSGGSPRSDGPSEARMMAEVLIKELGVKALVLEEHSRTTWENARLIAPLLKQQGIENIFLVTHAWHMPRAMQSFEGTGLIIKPAPTAFASSTSNEQRIHDWLPSASALRRSSWAIHEQLGYQWYRLKRQMNWD